MPKPATIKENNNWIANVTSHRHLQNPDLYQVAESLQIAPEIVSDILNRREVKAYIDQVFYATGFNNRFKMGDLMDSIIKKKLQDMDEAETGSTKDISELLALKHKMLMEHMDREIKLEALKASNTVKTQTNIQINEAGGTRYSQLIERLMTSDNGRTGTSPGVVDV